MDSLRIHFTDFWPGFNPQENLIKSLLELSYKVELDSENPDLLFYSCYGFRYLNFTQAKRIYYTAENVRPNFTDCDFALSFDYDDYQGRNYRLPLYNFTNLDVLVQPSDYVPQLKPKFCNMVVSNPHGLERNAFYEALNARKKVDSGGKFKNNVGGPVLNKLEFISQYKFTLAFENSSFPGYVTEKLIEPMQKNSIPIYWGSERVADEFNSKSFINVHDYPNWNAVMEHILALDADDEAYLAMLREPWLKNNQRLKHQSYDGMKEALCEAVEKVMAIPTQRRAAKNKWQSQAIKWRKKLKSKITGKAHWYC